MNTNDREQQPAGDGGRYVEVLRRFIENARCWLGSRAKCARPGWMEAQIEAAETAIAALTAAGRGGEECPHCAAYRLCADVANRRADRMAGLAAAPQQPPPVPMRDYVLDFITNTPEDVTHKKLVERGWTPPAGQPPPVGDDFRADVKCIHCGHPTMHIGDVCFPCGKAIKRLSHQQPAPSVSHDEFFGPLDRRAVIFPPKPVHPAPVSEPAASGERLHTMTQVRDRFGIKQPDPKPSSAIPHADAASGEGQEALDRAAFAGFKPETPRETMKRADKARNFPHNTCSASRHAQMIGEALVKREQYPMLAEEPEHCGQSILAAIASLYEARRLTTTGQGDVELLDAVRKLGDSMHKQAVERLVEAAREAVGCLRGCEVLLKINEQPTTTNLREALAPFGQQQEGSQ